jgi:hypothetical protein
MFAQALGYWVQRHLTSTSTLHALQCRYDDRAVTIEDGDCTAVTPVTGVVRALRNGKARRRSERDEQGGATRFD